MGRNKKKDIADKIFIISAAILLILYHFIKDNKVGTIIFIILIIVDIMGEWIFNLIVWRCPKCREHLPGKRFYKNVECCPYCKNRID